MSIVEYLGCPFCGKSVVTSRIRPETLENFSADWNILQVREAQPGPGRGRKIKGVGGFVVDPFRSMPIYRMLESPEHRDLAVAVKNRLLKIVGEYLRVGAITREEIDALLREAA
ncbi:unnamed protein product [marine sediment metagenome]|uniref:Uncharacterized protein n=1 Tax=marine sediment metagenome TaxID=412755 RepID=X1E706_9ZZZZ